MSTLLEAIQELNERNNTQKSLKWDTEDSRLLKNSNPEIFAMLSQDLWRDDNHTIQNNELLTKLGNTPIDLNKISAGDNRHNLLWTPCKKHIRAGKEDFTDTAFKVLHRDVPCKYCHEDALQAAMSGNRKLIIKRYTTTGARTWGPTTYSEWMVHAAPFSMKYISKIYFEGQPLENKEELLKTIQAKLKELKPGQKFYFSFAATNVPDKDSKLRRKYSIQRVKGE